MNTKLLILLLLSSLLFTGCYTTYHYIPRNTINDVYTYDNYIYKWNTHFYPYYYTSLIWSSDVQLNYPYYNKYKPIKHRQVRPFHKNPNVWKNHHYPSNRSLMLPKTNITKQTKIKLSKLRREKVEKVEIVLQYVMV